MHNPPIIPQIIKIEIFVPLLCMIFADRHGANFFSNINSGSGVMSS